MAAGRKLAGGATDLTPQAPQIGEITVLYGGIDCTSERLPNGSERRVLTIAPYGASGKLYRYEMDTIMANALARKMMRGDDALPPVNGSSNGAASPDET